MSIYASLPGIEGAREYVASHILPSEHDHATASIGLAFIPSHITRDGRDDQPEDGMPWPWARLDVAYPETDALEATYVAAVINPTQARDLARQLTEWADSAETPLDRLRATLATKPTEYEETP